MLNFLQTVVVFAAGIFVSGLIVRYGLKLGSRIDAYFLRKARSRFGGYQWMNFLPTKLGKLYGYFQYRVLGIENYFKGISWPVKVASIVSLLLFIAYSSNKQSVIDYYSLTFFKENDMAVLFGSQISVWFFHVITLSYIVLFALILIESIRMHKFYAPVRFVLQVVFSALMSVLTVFSVSVLIIVSIIYIALKIIQFLFFNKADKGDQEKKKGFSIPGFQEYLQSRASYEPETVYKTQQFFSEEKKRKKTKTGKVETETRTEATKPIDFDDDIGRIYPD